ncbi:MAG: response regulator [Verrucomicrobia bacterium]|nr:response regulator [Verrucomicrobiota bacterium]
MNQDSRKLLIIEDDQIIANIYKSKFEKAGYEVDVATDGQAGFYRVHEYKPNAVLLDLMLPHMNGVDILKKIRAQKRFERLPIVVFTNGFLSEYAQDAAVSGANLVFNKATTMPQQIIDAVNSAIGQLSPGVMVSGAATAPAPAPAVAESSPTTTAPAVSAPVAAPAVSTSGASINTDGDASFQAELLQDFLSQREATIALLRRLLQSCTKCEDENARPAQWLELHRKIHGLAGTAGMVGLTNIAQLSGATAALVKELQEKPKSVTVSTTQTVAQAVDLLGTLFELGTTPMPDAATSSNILVVDDEVISRRAVTYALDKAQLRSTAVEDPNEALKLFAENNFDLIILDIDMPGINGLELCTRLREVPSQKNTPVIFVTGLTDFEHRTKSKLSGGNDFIAKPFLFIELTVKALLNVLRHRLPSPPA